MIYRMPIKCDICDEIYTLRISIGHATVQAHTFVCESCGEDITVRLYLNKSADLHKKIEFENCTESDLEGKIINLHPEVVFSKELAHVDIISPSILAMSKMMNHEEKTLDAFTPMTSKERKNLVGIFSINEEWSTVNKIWSLENRNKTAQLKNFIEKSKENIFEYKEGITGNEIIFSFLFRCLAPGLEDRLDNVLKLIVEEYRKDPESFRDFLNYHTQHIFRNNIEKIHGVVRDFFVNYPEYSQSFLEIKKGSEIKEQHSYSSVNFEKTKKFYGDAYECLGSCATTFACLSNIIKGRKFNTFDTINLDKYLILDKSGKGKCFSDIPEFHWLMRHYIPQLRNGSHHGTFKFDSEKKVILFTPTKNQQVHSIEYFDYLNKCAYIFFSCCIVGAVDIFLATILRSDIMRNSN